MRVVCKAIYMLGGGGIIHSQETHMDITERWTQTQLFVQWSEWKFIDHLDDNSPIIPSPLQPAVQFQWFIPIRLLDFALITAG